MNLIQAEQTELISSLIKLSDFATQASNSVVRSLEAMTTGHPRVSVSRGCDALADLHRITVRVDELLTSMGIDPVLFDMPVSGRA